MKSIDTKLVEKIDQQDLIGAIDAQPNQLRQNYADTMRDDITAIDGELVKNIVFVGMGGSALAGDICANWLNSRILLPFKVIRSNQLPGFVDKNTLVIISSYSGNTAETLRAFELAQKNNCQVIAIGGGGTLEKKCKAKKIIFLKLPKVSQPRIAVFAGLKALACLLDDMKIVTGDLRRELLDSADFLDTQKLRWSADNSNNLAVSIAKKLLSRNVLIYSSPILQSTGYKWKIDINENAKQMAFCDNFSELNHNEIESWGAQNRAGFEVVILTSNQEDTEMTKRIKLSTDILHSNGFSVQTIQSIGQNIIQNILYSTLLGDYVSAYLAILNNTNPTPVEIVEKFKTKLNI